MKIAIFSEEFKLSISGTGSFVSNLAESLLSLGHEVLVVTISPNCNEFKLGNSTLICPSVKLSMSDHANHRFTFDSSKADGLNSYIQNFKPDIIHLNSASSLDFCASNIAQELGIPTIFYMHNFCNMPKNFKPLILYKYKKYKNLLLKILNNSNLLCGISPKIAENISYLAPSKEILICPPAVNTEFFDNNKILPVTAAKIRSKLKLNSDDFVAIFAGHLTKSKYISEILEIWKLHLSKNKKFKLLIVGDGPEKSNLCELVDRLGLRDQVIFTGKVKREKMLYFYTISNLMVSNTLTDICAMSILEANSCGLPILMPRKSPNLFFTQEGLTSFSYDTPKEFIQFIKKFNSFSKSEISIMKNLVRKEALSNKSISFAKKMVSLYRRAIQLYISSLESSGKDFIGEVDIFSEEIVDISNYVDETKSKHKKA